MSEAEYRALLMIIFDESRSKSDAQKQEATIKVAARVLSNFEILARGQTESIFKVEGAEA